VLTDYYDNDAAANPTNMLDAPPLTTVPEMKEFLYSIDQVFLDPLTPSELEAASGSAASILENVDVKTQDIVDLLQNDKALEAAFSRLTDQVEYKDFWTRYFVRLEEEDALTQAYQTYSKLQKQEAHRTERETAGNALQSVTSFLGGAVKRLIQETNDDGDDDDDDINEGHDQNEKGDDVESSQRKTGGPLSFFQVTGRPPFVLNTAVSDDDEEELDPLGWDDDDDDRSDEDGKNGPEGDEDEGKEGQIEFKDAEKESLQEELAQAITERDMLHKTVEMQTEEIKKLREGVASKDESKQVEAFKMQLFEKDSELAALRARMDDDQDRAEPEINNEELVSLRREVEVLRTQLAERDSEILRLKEDIVTAAGDVVDDNSAELRERLDNALSEMMLQKAALETLTGEKKNLLEQLESMKSSMERVLAESNALRKAQKELGGESTAQLAAMQLELSDTKSRLENLTSENQSLQSAMHDAKAMLASAEGMQRSAQITLDAKEQELGEVRQSLATAKAELESKRREVSTAAVTTAQATQPSSPGSSSTGVKIPSPPEVLEPVQPEVPEPEVKSDDDDGSDWGEW
jgi:hypothetical protein